MHLSAEMFVQHRARARAEALAALDKASGKRVQAVHMLATSIEEADRHSDFERGDRLCCAIRQLVLDKDEAEPLDADLADEGLKVVMRMATGCQDLSRQARRMLVAIDIGHKKWEAYSDQHTVEGCIEALGTVTAEIADRGDVEFAMKLLPSLDYGSSDVLACAALARVLTLQGEETSAYLLVEARKEGADREEPRWSEEEEDEEEESRWEEERCEPTCASVFIELLIAAAHHSQGNIERAEEIVLALREEGGLEILAEDLNCVVKAETKIAQKLLEQAASVVDLCDGVTARFLLLYAEIVEEE